MCSLARKRSFNACHGLEEFFFLKFGFTPYQAKQAEQPLQGIELQEEEETQKYSILVIFLERNYS